MNRVTVVGNLSKDVELRYTAEGTAVASFSIAVNRPFSNQQGQKEVDFFPVVVWRKQAENTANFLKKGSKAGIDGRLQTRSYEKDGRKVYVTEIVAEHVEFLDSRPSQDAPARETAPPKQQQAPNSYQQQYPNVSDDDLPF